MAFQAIFAQIFINCIGNKFDFLGSRTELSGWVLRLRGLRTEVSGEALAVQKLLERPLDFAGAIQKFLYGYRESQGHY